MRSRLKVGTRGFRVLPLTQVKLKDEQLGKVNSAETKNTKRRKFYGSTREYPRLPAQNRVSSRRNFDRERARLNSRNLFMHCCDFVICQTFQFPGDSERLSITN
jgi:hypothetical protein